MSGVRPWADLPLEVFVTNPSEGGGAGGEVTVANFPATQAVTGTVTCNGTVSVGNFPASQAVTGTFWPATQTVSGTVNATCSGTVNIGNFPASQAVTGTFWQATQPVSGTVTANVGTGTQPVSGTFWQATQPVSGPLTDAQLRAAPVPISGNLTSAPQPSTLWVTQTANISLACTATLPAAGAGLFHYITAIEIASYAGAAIATAATAVTVTTTNLPGNPVFNHQRLHSAGQSFQSGTRLAGNPIRSATANTATTVVCPVLTGCIWRINVVYYVGA